MKTLLKNILIFIIGIQLNQAQEYLQPAEIYRNVNDAVVEINASESSIANQGYYIQQDFIGSGVVISPDGLVLTAAHVVQTAEVIKVKFTSGEEVLAKVVRLSKAADVALIKLAWIPEDMKVANLADSDKVEMGEKICIIGAPFGLSHSLSVGYISGKHIEKNRSSGFVRAEFFQTDAAINQGNSGGPMFNSRGEVVGIVSSILTETGGFQGIGFAATSNVTEKLVIQDNSLYTGMDGFFLDKNIARLLNIPQDGGLLVQRVVPFSPADLNGIKGGTESVQIFGQELILGGDVILAVNNTDITSVEDLDEALEGLRKTIGSSEYFELKVLREGRIERLSIKLTKL